MQSRGPATPTVVETPAEFAHRVAFAINARCGVGRAISYKTLAWNIKVSEQTVWSWAKGEKAPSGPALFRLLGFFDAAFANEILQGAGCTVVKLEDVRKAKAISDAMEAAAEAAGLNA